MGDIKDVIPTTTKAVAIFILLVNIFFPGLGTIIMSCLTKEFSAINIVIGLLQGFLSICIIGWVWSVIWGLICVQQSYEDNKEEQQICNDFYMKNNEYNTLYRVETRYKPNYSDSNNKL